MKLREYEYILAIAEEQNMSRAAEKLFISQPALSKLLASVESDLGIALFEQRSRRMAPTAAGKVYIENARRMIEMNARMEMDVRGASIRPEISLAYPFVYSSFISRAVLPRILASGAELVLREHVASNGKLRDGLMKEAWPLAFGIVEQEHLHMMQYRPVGHQEIVLAVPKGHMLEAMARGRADCTYPYVAAQALQGVDFLFSRANSHSGKLARTYFDVHRVTPHVVYNAWMTGSLYHVVAQGLGAAIVPDVPLRHMGLEDKATYLSIDTRDKRKAVGILYRKDYALSAQEETLVAIIHQAYGAQACEPRAV